MKKIIFLYIGIVAVLFGSALYVQAVDLQLPAFTTESSSLGGMISQIYLYALSIAGVLAIVMIIYGGISYALDPGNASKQNEAKDIMQSAIWGILLLAGAYIILKTINPDLVQLRELPLENITLTQLDITTPDTDTNDTGSHAGGTSVGCTTSNVDSTSNAKLASDLLALNPDFSGSTKCPSGSLPKQNVQNVKDGKLPLVCNDLKCGCATGGTGGDVTLCPDLLRGLTKAQTEANAGTLPKFTIRSLTGDTHDHNSTHYQGRGADVTIAGDRTAWFNALKGFSKYASASLEYKPASGGKAQFIKLSGSSSDLVKVVSSVDGLSPAWCQGCSNQHLHMNFGGAGTQDSNPNDTYGYALRKELSELAKKYLALGPNLLSDANYGFPSMPGQKKCSEWPKSSAQGIINDTASEQIPFVCNGSKVDTSNFSSVISYCGCSQGGVNGKVVLSKNVLNLLIDLETQKKNGVLPSFQIASLTGGNQMKDDIQSHYSGVGIDIVPLSNKVDDWNKIMKYLKDKGYTPLYAELSLNPTNSYIGFSTNATVLNGNSSVREPSCQSSSKLILGQYPGPLCPVGSIMCCFDGRIHVTAFDK